MCIVHDIKTTQTTSISLCLASNLVCHASASSSLPLPCLASVKDIAALPRLCLDLCLCLDKTALSPSLLRTLILCYCGLSCSRLARPLDSSFTYTTATGLVS